MLDHTFNKLCPYDPVDLIATFGALQLVPQNAHHTIRLEIYANVAASHKTVGNVGEIGHEELLVFLQDDGLSGTGIHEYEDPCGNLFTESMMFRGGGYTVLPGITYSATYMLKNIVKAIFLSRDRFPDHVFAYRVEQIVGAALVMSDAVADAAGLSRWMPVEDTEGKVHVPSPGDFGKLKGAVRWAKSAFSQRLQSLRISPSELSHIVSSMTNMSLVACNGAQNPLCRRPVLSHGEEYILAAPGSILSATINAVLDLAKEHGVLSDLAQSFNAAVFDSVNHTFRRMNLSRPVVVPLPHEIPCLQDCIVSIDTDKVMHVLVVTDPLDDYKPLEKRSSFDRSTRASEVVARISQVEQWLARSQQGMLNDIIHMIILQGLTRDEIFAFDKEIKPKSCGLVLTGDELDVVFHKELGDALAIWKFIRARERAREQCEVRCFDAIDEYAFYIEYSHGYYVSEESKPTVLQISPGFSAKLRHEVVRQRDYHAVLSYDQKHVFEVTKLHGAGDVSIYFPLKDLGKRACLLLGGFSLPVWVLGPVYEDDEQSSQHSSYAQLTDCISYWLWQFTPALKVAMEHLVERFDQLHCLVQLPPPESWELQQSQPSDDGSCTVEANKDAGTLHISILPGLTAALSSEDNCGERQLILAMLRGIRALLLPRQQGVLSEQVLAEAMEKYAPLGNKKKLLIIDATLNPGLDCVPSLPDKRPLQESDREFLLDDLGEFLLKEGWVIGDVPLDQREKLLRKSVEYLYGRLQSLVSTLSSQGLLEFIMARHERLTRDHAFLRLTTPTQIACFSNQQEVIEELRTTLPKSSHLRLASRFLIEYVAARPPHGIRPISMSVYDELIAVTAEIVDLGAWSDLSYFQVEDIRWSLLAGGRLGRDVRRYGATRKEYLRSHALGQIHRARGGFASHWRERDRHVSDFQDQVNAAMVAEVGLRFTEIMDMLSMAMTMGLGNGDVCSKCQEDDFIRRAAEDIGISQDTARRALALLVLEPREDYLNPPGFRQSDTYPWRLNRPLSYVRRPFVLRNTDQGRELLWGFRHVDQVARYWIDAWFYGRIEAQSQEMKKLVGRLHNERGRDFNDYVAKTLQAHSGLIVEKRVKKFNGLRFPQALGDIDVLLAIPDKRRLRLIECKDLEVARMPHEVNSELLKTFKGKPGKKSAVEKHLKRLEWVQAHANEVLEFLGCNDGGTWKAEALFVTDTELLTPFLQDSPVRFVPIAEIDSIL